MRKTSPNVSDEEVAKIISEVDLDGDGTINFDGKEESRAPRRPRLAPAPNTPLEITMTVMRLTDARVRLPLARVSVQNSSP